MDADQHARDEILYLLRGGNAHVPVEEAVGDYPMGRINPPFPTGTYTAWPLLEHLPPTQADILDFIRNPSYAEREWPRDYWPPQERTATPDEWRRTLDAFREDARALQAIVADPATDLYARIPHGDGQTIFREMLVVADHNAYHLAEFPIMLPLMGT